ncbi:MAG: ribD 1, partial [Mycobacterium sp.]|nr:ribD 1 [Mycobacterium sp.]
ILLGGPVTAVDDVGVASIVQAQRWRYDGVLRLGPDLRVSMVPS